MGLGCKKAKMGDEEANSKVLLDYLHAVKWEKSLRLCTANRHRYGVLCFTGAYLGIIFALPRHTAHTLMELQLKVIKMLK
jgi:hypothetical protein